MARVSEHDVQHSASLAPTVAKSPDKSVYWATMSGSSSAVDIGAFGHWLSFEELFYAGARFSILFSAGQSYFADELRFCSLPGGRWTDHRVRPNEHLVAIQYFI
jgi:hypothetical protein